MSEENTLSFAPSDAAEGGLPVVGATVVLGGATFLNRKSKDGDTGEEFIQPCFGINMIDYQTGINYGFEGGPQSYSVGNSAEWIITDEGDILAAVKGTQFKKSTKFMIFTRELVNAGFPEERLKKGDISVINNTVVVMGEVPFLFGGEVQMRKGKDGKDYPVKVVVPTVVTMLPEDYAKEIKKSGKKTDGAGGDAKKKTDKVKKDKEESAMDDDALLAATVTAVTEILDKTKDGTLAKAALMAQVMKHLMKADYRNEALALIDKNFEDVENAALESSAWIVDEDIIQKVE